MSFEEKNINPNIVYGDGEKWISYNPVVHELAFVEDSRYHIFIADSSDYEAAKSYMDNHGHFDWDSFGKFCVDRSLKHSTWSN